MRLGVFAEGGLGDQLIYLNVLQSYLAHLHTFCSEPIHTEWLVGYAGDLDFLQRVPFIEKIDTHMIPALKFNFRDENKVHLLVNCFDVLVLMRYVGRVCAEGKWYFLDSMENPKWKAQWYPHYQNHPRCCTPLAELGHFKDVLARSLGVQPPKMKLPISLVACDMSMVNCLPTPYVVLGAGVDPHLQSSKQTKSIPLDWLRQVALYLIVEGYNVLEVSVMGTLSLELPGVINLIGETTVAEVACILDNAQGMLLTEGGLAHLAACLHKKAVVLFGPTDPKFLGYPIHQNLVTSLDCSPCYFSTIDWYLTCPQHRGAECMSSFEVTTVVEALLS